MEDLRAQLAEWQAAGAMQSSDQVDEVISELARSAGMEPQAVRMLWAGLARETRAIEGPMVVYVKLAKQLHGVDVTVVDLGQYSDEHSNSCMFLTCAASLAHRRLCGYADAELPGILGRAIGQSGLDQAAQCSTIEDLIVEHKQSRHSTLGRIADALRYGACEELTHSFDSYAPYFTPVARRGHRGATSMDLDDPAQMASAYETWLARLRGDEEGDELVVLALARLCGLAVQPVQKSGYRVPLMDPTESVADNMAYWGNDDVHWVWLRKSGD